MSNTTTHRRKLRSSGTYWEYRTPRMPRMARRAKHAFYDVVILGTGISGALTADAVSTLGLRVLMLDRREPASASTAASTALIQWEIDEPLGALIKKVGRARAVKCYKATYRALMQLGALIVEGDIDCDYKPRKTLFISGNKMKHRALQSEVKLRRRIGLPSRYLDPETLKRQYGFKRDGAILSTGSCEMDPRAFTKALLLRARKRGVEIVTGVEVVDIEATRLGVMIDLGNNTVIAARKVIAATGYETLPQIPKDRYQLISTWALATEPVREDQLWHDSTLVWEAADPYLYFRTTPDHRIIVGGEDAEYVDPERRDAQIAKKASTILAKLQTLLPDTPLSPAFTWAGTFAASPTGLPVIGELDSVPNVFAILGSGGNGITFSFIAAQLAKAWLTGQAHPLADVFAP